MSAQNRPSDSVIDCVSAAIGFDTVSRNSNLKMIEWAADRLESLGASVRYTYNDERSKANLLASFGDGSGGVVLSGHTDVVPVDGQDWHSDPFSAVVKDDRLYGRGACDMKGFIGVVLAQATHFKDMALREPIHIALSYDEEVGCLGISSLIEDMKKADIQPTGCIVGEPTSMQVVSAHKGGRIYRCRVQGCAAHSSLTPQGVNAIEYAANVILHIQQLAQRESYGGARLDGFDVPFSTISTNTIQGGNGMNIIPASCEFSFDYRYLPGVNPDGFIEAIRAYAMQQVLPRMRERHPQAAIDFECIGSIPALDESDSADLQALILGLLGERSTKRVAYGTEASFFKTAGVPSIVCGPGSIDVAHKPDEYVSLEQLAACEAFIQKFLLTMVC